MWGSGECELVQIRGWHRGWVGLRLRVMKGAWLVMVAVLLVSCSGPEQALTIKQFTLRDAGNPEGDDPMVRGEVQRRLYGAVSASEREDRIGQYYTVQWHDDSALGKPVEVVFDYQQAATGSRVKRETRGFDPQSSSGQTEFKFIGEEFRDNGRVLAWRVALMRGGRELASKQSYLWE